MNLRAQAKQSRCIFLALLLIARLASAAGPTDEEILAKLKLKLGDKAEYTERNLRRIGNRTLELEVFVAGEGSYETATQVFSDWSHFADWALKNINRRADGGTYYMKINGLSVSATDNSVLEINSFLDLPMIKKEVKQKFRMKTEKPTKGVFTLSGEVILDEKSLLDTAGGYLKIFPVEGKSTRLWVYIRGEAKLKSWVIYEALPERLLTRESGERIQIVMDNYLTEEDRLKAALASRPLSNTVKTPKEKR